MISLPAKRNLHIQRNADIWAMTTASGGARPLATTPLHNYGWYMQEQIRDGLGLILYVFAWLLCAESSEQSLCQVWKHREWANDLDRGRV